MAVRRIPWIDGPRWSQEVSLDGRPYVLRAHYNVRSGFWTLSIGTRSRVLVSGLRLVKLWPLLRQVRTPDLPPGEMYVAGTGEPTRSNMGDGCHLYYIEASDAEPGS